MTTPPAAAVTEVRLGQYAYCLPRYSMHTFKAHNLGMI
jgi:hypothetical protein